MKNNDIKKDKERLIFDRFQSMVEMQSQTKFYEVSSAESPDFNLVIDGKHIGVELTGIYQDDIASSKGSNHKIHQQAYIQFTDDVIRRIQTKSDVKFTLGIKFTSDNGIDKSFKSDYSGLLANVCLQVLTLLSNKQIIEIQNTGNMPEQIYSIIVCRYDELDFPINLTCSGGVLPTLRADIIDNAIRVKEKKLHDYRKMDKQWLLIVEGSGFAGSFSNIDISDNFLTSFDKIFVYRAFNHELIELNLSKRSCN